MSERDISQRLRRSIVLNDQLLARRILKGKPALLRNPDYDNKSNTSLHLTAQLGLFELAVFLIDMGHDQTVPTEFYIHSNTENNQGISVNTDGHTPLHLAAANSQTTVSELLCQKFPASINRSDNNGLTPLLLAAKAQTRSALTNNKIQNAKGPVMTAEDTSTIETLLEYGADVSAQDHSGNTCLHYACAWGNLKAVRILMEAGADPLCSNYAGWRPGYYSLTVQAEVYYKNLVAEYEQRRAEERKIADEQKAKHAGSVRLVTGDDDEVTGVEDNNDDSNQMDYDSDEAEFHNSRSRAGSSRSTTTTGSTSF